MSQLPGKLILVLPLLLSLTGSIWAQVGGLPQILVLPTVALFIHGGRWPAKHICTYEWGQHGGPRQSHQVLQSGVDTQVSVIHGIKTVGRHLLQYEEATGMKWKAQNDFIPVFYICTYRYILFHIHTRTCTDNYIHTRGNYVKTLTMFSI